MAQLTYMYNKLCFGLISLVINTISKSSLRREAYFSPALHSPSSRKAGARVSGRNRERAVLVSVLPGSQSTIVLPFQFMASPN